MLSRCCSIAKIGAFSVTVIGVTLVLIGWAASSGIAQAEVKEVENWVMLVPLGNGKNLKVKPEFADKKDNQCRKKKHAGCLFFQRGTLVHIAFRLPGPKDQDMHCPDAKNVIRTENLLPTTLISRLHNNYPQHSLFKRKSAPIFSKGKNKYTGLLGFRMICKVLKQHNIVLSDIKERELFIEVYAFLATKHILNTIDWNNYQVDPVFQLVFPQPNMMLMNITALKMM